MNGDRSLRGLPSRLPSAENGHAEDVAQAICALIENDYISGVVLPVDGRASPHVIKMPGVLPPRPHGTRDHKRRASERRDRYPLLALCPRGQRVWPSRNPVRKRSVVDLRIEGALVSGFGSEEAVGITDWRDLVSAPESRARTDAKHLHNHRNLRRGVLHVRPRHRSVPTSTGRS